MRLPTPSFFRAQPLTLLVVLPRRLVRADFAGRPARLSQLWQSDAPMGETLAVLADAAFALGPNRRTRVHLLAANSWVGVLTLSSAKAGTLSAAELAQALGFEAETLSNINPFDSLLAATPLGSDQGNQSFRVTQASRAEVVAVEDTLLRRGAWLAGLAHPGGLPRPLGGDATVPWQRIELWGDNVICLDRAADNALRLQVFAAATAGQGDLPAEAGTWLGQQTEKARRETMVAPGVAVKSTTAATHDLNDESVLGAWLVEWANELDSPRVPVLRPPPRPMSTERRLAVTALWTAAAISLCAAHWFWIQHHEDALQRELVSAQAPAKKMDALKSQADGAEKQLAGLREQTRVIAQLCQDWNLVMQQERKRHAILLDAIAGAASDDFVLRSLTESAGALQVSALAVRPELPNVTAQLATAVEPFGWRVASPTRQALQVWSDGGPWQLDWTLQPANTSGNADIQAISSPQQPKPATGSATRQVGRPKSRFQQ